MMLRFLLGLSLLSLGCGDDDAAATDSGTDAIATDTGGDDAGGDDAGGDDAGGDDAGGDDAGSADTGGTDPATAFCEAAIARDERCGDTPRDLEECISEQLCVLNVIFRSDAAPEVVACYADLDCDASDDPCFSATGLELEPSEGAADYATGCATRREECGASFSDDFCAIDLAAETVYPMLETCLESECDMIEDCLIGVLSCEE